MCWALERCPLCACSGRLPGGDTYYVVDWIDGENIAAILRRRALSVSESLHVVLAVAPALTILHDIGQAHLDIKPENIIVPRAGDGLRRLDSFD